MPAATEGWAARRGAIRQYVHSVGLIGQGLSASYSSQYRTTFAGTAHTRDTLTDGMQRLEQSIESLHSQLACLINECEDSQSKLSQRIANLEQR